MLHLIAAGLTLISLQEDELTPARTLELLHEAHRLMEKAEALLNDSSRGTAAEAERRILEAIDKLVGKAEKSEKDAADKLGDVLRKTRSAAASEQRPGRNKPPGRGAKAVEKPSKFISPAAKSGSWGNLPSAAPMAMLDAGRDEVPPEFRQLWKRYVESFSDR